MALGAAAAYSADRVEPPTDDDAAPAGRAELAERETGFGLTDDRIILERLVERLPEREQEIIRLRFFDELTQAEIADRIGLSQMHVSRLLRKAFEQMKTASRTRQAVRAAAESDQESAD